MPAPEVTAPKDHVVHLYDGEGHLATAVADYLADGLHRGEVALVIATHDHIGAFQAELSDVGIDVDAVGADGRLVWLDAADALASIMTGDRPDPAAFDATVGAPVRAAQTRGPVRAYGEMVAVLWAQGLIGPAMELEALWNDLRREVPFALLCSYASGLVADHDDDTLSQLCRLHSELLGAGLPRCVQPETPAVDVRTRSFPQAVTSPRAARSFLGETLHDWRVASIIDDASLVVAELTANAVTHARSAFTLTLVLRPDSLEIAVHDNAAAVPVPRTQDVLVATGRGMRLVDALASRWGTEMGNPGKTVWAELPLVPGP